MQWLECQPDSFSSNFLNEKLREGKNEAEKTYEDKLSDMMLTQFTDDNVTFKEGKLDDSNGDRDIHKSILFNLYNNMAACFIKMGNYKEA